MKKPILLAPRNMTREMLPSPDVERMLNSGSWLQVVVPKRRDRAAKNMEAFKQKRREMGYRILYAHLPEELFAEMQAAKLPGETIAQLIKRLLGIAASKSKDQT